MLPRLGTVHLLPANIPLECNSPPSVYLCLPIPTRHSTVGPNPAQLPPPGSSPFLLPPSQAKVKSFFALAHCWKSLCYPQPISITLPQSMEALEGDSEGTFQSP